MLEGPCLRHAEGPRTMRERRRSESLFGAGLGIVASSPSRSAEMPSGSKHLDDPVTENRAPHIHQLTVHAQGETRRARV